ncbi:MAG: hypothetical protein PHR36_00830 [Patescibacteria group bacterium]|nr:hypothetical protein [Patescibacteria group bacterium]
MEGLKQNQVKFISLKNAKKLIFSLILVFLFDFFLFPMPALALEAAEEAKTQEMLAEIALEEINEPGQVIVNHLPENDVWAVERVVQRVITAYNSEVGQCDDSPCITANGFNVCEHGEEDTIAANFLKFGTKVRIPELFGDKIFVVRDRMNSKFANRVDVWMVEKQDARKFGEKLAKIEILR